MQSFDARVCVIDWFQSCKDSMCAERMNACQRHLCVRTVGAMEAVWEQCSFGNLNLWSMWKPHCRKPRQEGKVTFCLHCVCLCLLHYTCQSLATSLSTLRMHARVDCWNGRVDRPELLSQWRVEVPLWWWRKVVWRIPLNLQKCSQTSSKNGVAQNWKFWNFSSSHSERAVTGEAKTLLK